jgi:hypothetical protein
MYSFNGSSVNSPRNENLNLLIRIYFCITLKNTENFTGKNKVFTGKNKVLLALGQRTSAHHEDWGYALVYFR